MQTMNLDQLRASADAVGITGITLKARGAAFIVDIETRRGHAVMVTSRGRSGEAPLPRKFLDPRKVLLLLREVGTHELRIDGDGWRPDDVSEKTSRPDRSVALKAMHEGKQHADWLVEKVQASLLDPSPNVSHMQVIQEAQAVIDRKREQHGQAARKAARAEWRAQARADLLEIVAYIADDNPDAAQQLNDEIEDKVARLPEQPKHYRASQRVKGMRELPVRSSSSCCTRKRRSSPR